MCGIIGYTGFQSVTPILLEGLARLEYRGYDSTGIALINSTGGLDVFKSKGKLKTLTDSISGTILEGSIGIGHTRWATHGSPNQQNAHPHLDCNKDIVVAHNGIVENFLELKQTLEQEGHVFSSETDSECIPHLIEFYIAEGMNFEEAVRFASRRLNGSNAVIAFSKRNPSKIVGFKKGYAGGLVVGYGAKEMFISSDLTALLPHTRKVVYLSENEFTIITPGEAIYFSYEGDVLLKEVQDVPLDSVIAAKGEYEHFMLKEINEQPEAVLNSMRGRVLFDKSLIELEGFNITDDKAKSLKRVVLVGMGSSMHAAMVARYWIESLAKISAETDNSSEFRYRDSVLDSDTLVISVSQSGETADTLGAMGEASRQGALQVTFCNYEGTQATRIADSTVYIRSGLEVAVAGSKTFTCSLVSLYLFALRLGLARGTIDKNRLPSLIDELAQLPNMLSKQLADYSHYEELSRKYSGYSDFLFLGRGITFPIAMEGALKLKEISYIHAEGYPAGEMKHGPISLIDDNMPIVALLPKDKLYEKMLANISEATARDGKVIAIATQGDTQIQKLVEDVIFVPSGSSLVTPIPFTIPMQLLAYTIAVNRGTDVDQPRNLAKSVTVE